MSVVATTVACPHCGTQNVNGSAFCEACGKAVPSGAPTGPRILVDGVLPTTAAGQQMMGDELRKQLKKASGALLVVAILQTLFGAFMYAMLSSSLRPGQFIQPIFFVSVFGVAALFFGLWLWARKQPLPAAIVGLIVFVTLHVLDAIADPTQLARGIVMKIVVIAILVQAIQAGLKYRRLVEQQQVL